MNPQDSTQYPKHLDQIATTHVNTNTKNQFLMTPINVSIEKTQITNHIMIHFAAEKKTHNRNKTKKNTFGIIIMGVTRFQINENDRGKNSHTGGVKSRGHENSMRSGTMRLRRVVEWGDEGGEELESHCRGCEFG